SALASLRGDLCFDLSLYMGQLQTPTTLLWGEQARFSPLKLGQRLAALNPQIIQSVQPIADAGVLPHLEAPARVIGQLRLALNVRC
ncbi:MAG: alpha/beta fold hydrolase, partial [Elainella sp.]